MHWLEEQFAGDASRRAYQSAVLLSTEQAGPAEMKILLSAYACEPNKGSERGNGWNWAVHLGQLGHQVWVLTRVEGRDAIEGELAKNPLPQVRFVYVGATSPVEWITSSAPGFYSRYARWQWKAYKAAQELDRTIGFDVAHHVTWGSLQIGSQLWRLNKPFIFGPVGGGQVAPPAFKRYFAGQWAREAARSMIIKRLMPLNPLARMTLRHADLVLVSNPETELLARKLGGSRVEVSLDSALPQDYYPDRLPTRPRSREMRLLWVGRLVPIKGVLLALDALSKVSRELPITLTIVGNGWLTTRLPSWIAELGLVDKVHCTGELAWSEVKRQYQLHDVFLWTSLRDSLGAQVLEAMAQALPIVALDHQGWGRFLPASAGVKVPVTTPDEVVIELARAIEGLYHQPEKRVSMGRAACSFAKRHTWDRRAREISELYQDCISNHARLRENRAG